MGMSTKTPHSNGNIVKNISFDLLHVNDYCQSIYIYNITTYPPVNSII